MNLVDERQAEIERADESRWARYREYLSTLDAEGNIPPASRAKFWKLAEEMGFSPADVAGHIDTIRRHSRSKDADARSVAATEEKEKLEPQIAAWAARRAKLLEEIDAEGTPLLLRVQALEQTVQGLEWTRQTWTELEGEFPKLFGVPVVKKSAPAPVDPEHDAAEVSNAQSFLANFRDQPDGPVDVTHLVGTVTLESVQKAIRKGWLTVPPLRAASILAAVPKPKKDSAAERREQQRRAEQDRREDAEMARLTVVAERDSAKQFAARLNASPDDAGAVADLTPRAREILAKGVAAGWVELSPTHGELLKASSELVEVTA